MLKWLNITLAFGAIALVMTCCIAQGKLDVWVAHSLERVHPDDPPRALKSASVKVARNEYEAFQVIIRAIDGELRQVTVRVSSLRAQGGRIISKANIRLYREHYVFIARPSYRSNAQPGWYPDALIPFTNPYTNADIVGARFDGSPFDIPANKNQPIWVEIYVPEDATPDTYRGQLTVIVKNEPTAIIPIELTVWNFTLPRKPSICSNFGGLGRIFKKHGVSPDSDEGKQLFERYAQAFVEHRLEPPIPSWLYPKVNSDGSISTETTHDALKAYMERMHRVSFLIRRPPFKDPFGADREKALRYLREMYAYLKANNWHRHAYLYVVDEPNTKDAYELVRKWGKLIHDAHPDLKLLCTEQPTPQKPEWGTLIGAVDIWCPLWALIDEDALKERLEAGDELWSYTALCQGAKPTPWWQLDFPLLNYRIPLWQSWMSGMTGILYWSTVFWTRVKDPWTQPQTYGSERTPFNCEGLLFYPGVDAGIAGPVTSMRLKALRDGMEDYEYFVLLSQVVGKEAVSQLVKSIAPSWFKWETDPKRLLKAREQVAEMLIQNIR